MRWLMVVVVMAACGDRTEREPPVEMPALVDPRLVELERAADALCACEYWDCTGKVVNQLVAWAVRPQARREALDAASASRFMVALTRANACIAGLWRDGVPPRIEASAILEGIVPGCAALYEARSEILECDRLPAAQRDYEREIRYLSDVALLGIVERADADKACRNGVGGVRAENPCHVRSPGSPSGPTTGR